MSNWDANEAPVIEALDRIALKMVQGAARPTAEDVLREFLSSPGAESAFAAAGSALAMRTLTKAAKDSLRRRALPAGSEGEQLALIPEDARPSEPVVGVPAKGGKRYVRWLDLTDAETDAVEFAAVRQERNAIARRIRVQRFKAWRQRRQHRAA